jgi:threonine/homoserine/homoserine lactone efflux protein
MESTTLIRIIAGVLFVLLFWLCWRLYWMPTRVARRRDHPDAGSIFWINLLFGASIIGWAIAMIWAKKSIRADISYR